MANITVTTAAVFIPEIWQNEVRAYREAKLVAAKLVKRIDFVGKKGDVIHIPDVTAGTARTKSAGTDVTFDADTESEFTLSINNHEYSAFKLEDIVAIQSAYEQRSLYTKAKGYAIAKALDSAILALGASVTGRYAASDGSTAYTGTEEADIAEAGIRRVIERLDTADVPEEDRYLVLHPAQKNPMLAIARFTEYQMIGPGGMPIRTGQFGEIFGVQVFTTTQVPTVDTNGHENLLFQRDAFVLAVQLQPRVQAQYVVRGLATEVVVDNLYDCGIFRDSHVNSMVSPT
jgi:hypothetical protein